MKISYVKMTTERRAEYQIRTVLGYEDGRTVLKKCALTAAANDHIRHIEENGKILVGMFGSSHVAPCMRCDETSVQLGFVPGKSLGQLLEQAVLDEDEKTFRRYLAFYEDEVLAENGTDSVSGVDTENFSWLDLNGAGRSVNIDLTFDNIIIGASLQDWCVIDYEWLAAGVPRDVVRVRALRGFLSRSGLPPLRAKAWLTHVYPQLAAWLSAERYEQFERVLQQRVLLRPRKAYEKRIWTLEEKKDQIEARICSLKDQEIAARDEIIRKRNETIYERDRMGEKLIAERDAARRCSDDWQQHSKEWEQRAGQLQHAVECRDAELNDIRSSHAWKIMLYMWRVRDVVLPMDSKRRLFSKLVYKTLTQPRVMFSKLSFANIKKFYRYLGEESPADIEQRLALHVPNPANVKQKLDLRPIMTEDETLHEPGIEAYEMLIFHEEAAPCVSIIIPVYNEFHYTYNCLASILAHTKAVSYEIIVADDGSSDATKEIEQKVKGIRVIRQEENLRFLRNCNAAASEARGKYLLFLNNDTQVQEDWLAPLVRLMEDDDSIGMTGAKLVYPDGRLQEAGGILWQDGSAWNYGHGDDPTFVQYNYVKDVDYISGAAICIRHDLWNEIGGFDERFVPAYYEDTDLAFEVRHHGKRVVYQPLSVVVHFEGISNGTDTSSGQKAYQVANGKKFFEKWKDVLQKEHFPNAEHVTLARDRSRKKKYILVVDHYVPHYDTDAGGRCSFEYLNFFVELGLHVVFVGDNYFPHQPYTQELQQKGIEVLCGDNWTLHRFEKWLKANGEYIDYAYLQRPHIAVKYIDMVRRETKAKIFYFGHDLHFVRERRQYEIEKDSSLLKSAEKWEKIEMGLFEKADVIHVVGAYEQQLLEERLPGKPVRNIPLYLYDRAELEHMPTNSLAGRNAMIFVGGFNHKPNQDAIFWFMEQVYPQIMKELPHLKFYIVGSHPTDAVRALGEGNDNIEVTGFVTDERLAELYRLSCVNVIPLRYGAGIKGKVIETMYFGVPAVTTPIGAEGLPGVESCVEIVPVDDATACAGRVLALFKEKDRWQRESAAERAYILDHFTKEKAKEILRLDISPQEV